MQYPSSNNQFRIYTLFVCSFLALASLPARGQNTVIAGRQYNRSSFHQWLFGKHYRKEWATSVSVPGLLLDTAMGVGLKPYQEGGGRQSKTLRLHDPNGKEYVMRSLDKSFGRALPPIFQNSFVESVINDQVSLGHPYAAVTIPLMAEAAKIYHTNPRIVYIPQQPALDSFNKEYGDRLYLVEQRPDENWEEAANFGNSKKIVGTEKMLEKISEDNDHRPDQLLYVRSRLFDMLIGDASRHEDQWRWATIKKGDKTIYKAIPRDRDQAYGKFDGLLIKAFLAMADLQHLQTFRHDIPDVRLNNYPARNLDRQIANEVTQEQWVAIAKELQQAITDDVIEKAVKQLPLEVFPISGDGIINKLKARRDKLDKYASQYYLSLAKEVEVAGTKDREFFHITRSMDEKVTVTVSKIKKNGETATIPFYSRVFLPKETKEIRVYGLAGNDIYRVDGEATETIKTRIIGGVDNDSIVDLSLVKGGKHNTVIYDNHQNNITPSKEIKLHLSNDTAIHNFKYDGYNYNDEGFKPVLFYSFEDKLHVGLAYKVLRHGWRKDPFKSKHEIQANYSIMQKNLSFIYQGALRQVIGKWNLNLDANYDLMRWTNYYGLGNNTTEAVTTLNYYQMESKDLLATIILNRPLGKHVNVGIGPVYSMVQVLENKDRFIYQTMPASPKLYEQKHFAGAQASFSFTHLNDKAVPTKGISFFAGAQYLQNLKESGKQVARYHAEMQFYIPLLKHLVLAIRPGAATVTGQPEFFQYASVGGSRNLRGYARDRFWGTSFFYSANELQYLFNVRSHIFNGKAGLIGFYDAGRVWQKNETSNDWHTGYGGGFLIAPFNKIMASFTYGTSVEGSHIHIRLVRSL